MTRDLFDKYIWLVDTIYRAEKITFEEINKRWLRSRLSEGEDIPLRTFHNWRKAIEQIFDININCNRKAGYYYYIENTEDIEKGGLRNWLLNTFAVNNLINESHHLKNRILFEDIPSGRQFLTPIIEAMRDGLEIELHHQSFWYDEPHTYTIQPYCVKVFKQRWYVTGYCHERNALRTFSLDRILSLTTSDIHFSLPKDFNGNNYFSDSFGIITNETEHVDTIQIKVYGIHVLYVRALPLHHSQKEIKTTDEYSIFELRLKPSFDFKQELLSRGADIEVISPLSFRKEMIDEVQQVVKRYMQDQHSMALFPSTNSIHPDRTL